MKKKQVLKSLASDEKRTQPIIAVDSIDLPVFPCKLNDLRFNIRGISLKISESDLKEYFDTFGEVIDVFIDQELEEENSDEKPRTAHICFSHFDDNWPEKNHVICDTEVTLENVFDAIQKPTSTIVITGNIQELSGKAVNKYLYSFGEIIDYRRTVNWKTHKLSRFVFVKFQNAADVDKVLEVKDHSIKGVKVEIIPVPNY